MFAHRTVSPNAHVLRLAFAGLPLIAAAAWWALPAAKAADAPASQRVDAVQVQATPGGMGSGSLQATVEAVRQATLSTQVPGTVVQVAVKAGDRVAVGQLLVRVDARAAEQQVQASAAQVDAARAALVLADKELERQRALLAKEYISQAAVERALSQRDAAAAQLTALQAQTRAAQTQTGFFAVVAPFAGVVSDVPVTVGDMAMPGRPLVALHDPSALRVTAAVPQSLVASVQAAAGALRIEIPGASIASGLAPQSVQVLPSVDAQTHTATLRLGLPASVGAVAPGSFARVLLPASTTAATGGASTAAALWVPVSAVLRRGELTAVVALDAQGQPRLRQVRLGRVDNDRVEVLTGVREGESVAREAKNAVSAAR